MCNPQSILSRGWWGGRREEGGGKVKLRASNARGDVVPHLACAAVVFVFYQARESCTLKVGMHTALGIHKAGFWFGHTTDGDTNTPKDAV